MERAREEMSQSDESRERTGWKLDRLAMRTLEVMKKCISTNTNTLCSTVCTVSIGIDRALELAGKFWI